MPLLLLSILIIGIVFIFSWVWVLICAAFQALIFGAILWGLSFIAHALFGTVVLGFLQACVIALLVMSLIFVLRDLFTKR